ncbi:MAG: T9SS type A sorting domain-containing protein [Gemmatimonadales bacterium]|nr:T9SS type A sorting domain-containing protein [Gemmatimonadales bacterium]
MFSFNFLRIHSGPGFSRIGTFALGIILLIALPVMGAGSDSPLSFDGPVAPVMTLKSTDVVPAMQAIPVDIASALEEDLERDSQGLPPRFALPEKVSLTPSNSGLWQELDQDFDLWRLRIEAPGAVSVNLGFSEFQLPKGARLSLYPTDYLGMDDKRGVRVFTEDDNRADGLLWTPLVQAADITIELLMPRSERADYLLTLDSVNKGYRLFGIDSMDKQGTCNIDVVCPEGDDWWNEINSVGVYTINGSWFCTGAMINNTAEDGTPYFLTADHCGISTSNDQGIVVYWNFQSVNCGDLSGGSLADFTSGATFLAENAASDVTLILLDSAPDPDFNVTFSGWDRSGIAPSSGIAIHHPSCDEKAISFENDPLTITTYLQEDVAGDGTHFRIEDWDLGTTEPGSSGSPLYDPNHRIIGQLHGGYAACGNDASDWYGCLSVSWSFLASYLDPLSTGATTLDTYVPDMSGLAVTPIGVTSFEGDSGGPFLPESAIYTLENLGGTALDFSVVSDVTWLTVTGGSGTLPAFDTALVEVAVNGDADVLAIGDYTGVLSFANLTDGEGDTTRMVNLGIGVPQEIVSFPLDVDPGWTMEGEWAFGIPTGDGGEHGNPDPTSGNTGANVLGFNLAGDYGPDLAETHLTTTALDCSGVQGVTLKFHRWLGVEQPKYDHAYIRVSNNGVDFTTVWENPAEITDSAWAQVEYDISAIADDQATVYVRWTMGATDDSWFFCGWNIDDVEIWGLRSYETAVGNVPAGRLALGNHPNPFNPVTRISFDLPNSGFVRLEVFDLQGHLVRELVQDNLEAGPHNIVWNGKDDGGRAAGSGVYFGRLVFEGKVMQQKMVLLK